MKIMIVAAGGAHPEVADVGAIDEEFAPQSVVRKRISTEYQKLGMLGDKLLKKFKLENLLGFHRRTSAVHPNYPAPLRTASSLDKVRQENPSGLGLFKRAFPPLQNLFAKSGAILAHRSS